MSNLRILLFLVLVVVGAWGGVVPRKGDCSRKTPGLRGSRKVGIYHGESTDISSYPYVVSDTYMGSAHCTGVILSDSWVLSTADCVSGYDAYYTYIMAGAEVATSGEQSMEVWSTTIHPHYNSTTGDYNFALLNMDGTFTWTEKVKNISLPSERVSPATWLTVVGYGETDANDNDLMEGKMAVVNRQKCKKLYKSYNSDLKLTERMGCVYNKGKTTVCDGDFGAPLVKDDVVYHLAASVASTGECSSNAYPVITADVYSAVNWIKSTTGL